METDEELKLEAIKLAERILSKELDPNEGCDRIADIGRRLGNPEEFEFMSMLAHDQHGHEHVGIYAKDCIPEILAECKKIVSKPSSGD